MFINDDLLELFLQGKLTSCLDIPFFSIKKSSYEKFNSFFRGKAKINHLYMDDF